MYIFKGVTTRITGLLVVFFVRLISVPAFHCNYALSKNISLILSFCSVPRN